MFDAHTDPEDCYIDRLWALRPKSGRHKTMSHTEYGTHLRHVFRELQRVGANPKSAGYVGATYALTCNLANKAAIDVLNASILRFSKHPGLAKTFAPKEEKESPAYTAIPRLHHYEVDGVEVYAECHTHALFKYQQEYGGTRRRIAATRIQYFDDALRLYARTLWR